MTTTWHWCARPVQIASSEDALLTDSVPSFTAPSSPHPPPLPPPEPLKFYQKLTPSDFDHFGHALLNVYIDNQFHDRLRDALLLDGLHHLHKLFHELQTSITASPTAAPHPHQKAVSEHCGLAWPPSKVMIVVFISTQDLIRRRHMPHNTIMELQ